MEYKYRFLCIAITQKDDIIHVVMMDDELNTITNTKFEVIESGKYIEGIKTLMKTAQEIIGFNLDHEMEILKKYGFDMKYPMLDLTRLLILEEGIKKYDEHGNLCLPSKLLLPYTRGLVAEEEYVKNDAYLECKMALFYFDHILEDDSDIRKEYYPEDDY